jgi:hypothetical protein
MAWSQWHCSSGAFRSQGPPEHRWLIDQLIPGVGLTILQSLPKVGKSIFAWQLAEALALGEPFLNGHAVQKARPAYLQLDESIAEWHAQLELIGARDCEILMPGDPQPYVLADPLAIGRIRQVLDRCGIEVVIVDAFKDLLICDPNTADGIQRVLRALHAMIGPRPCILIHHVRKPLPAGGDDPIVATAGHHVLAASASAILHLQPQSLVVGGGRLLKRRVVPLARESSGRWLEPTRHGSPLRLLPPPPAHSRTAPGSRGA